jgi:two-component system, LytTR family, response regulator
MSKYTVIVADDHENSREILIGLVSLYPDIVVIDEARDGKELIEKVIETKPNLVLVDIRMPEMNGIDAVKSCLTIHPDLVFIFITAYDEHAIEAFDISAADYIVKPVEKSRLFQALQRASEKIQTKKIYSTDVPPIKNKLPIRSGRTIYFIDCATIILIEKIGRKAFIYTTEKTYETNEPLTVLEAYLTESFYKTHRSYIVNFNYVTHITPKGETYVVYFRDCEHYAHISKLKIKEVQQYITSPQ